MSKAQHPKRHTNSWRYTYYGPTDRWSAKNRFHPKLKAELQHPFLCCVP
jgi:hypothetical protein